MFDDVISTGLQAVLAEIFESVDKNQLNVSLVGDIFKESHLELTDLRLKKTLLKDMNLPVEVKEGLVGKLVIQGLSGTYEVREGLQTWVLPINYNRWQKLMATTSAGRLLGVQIVREHLFFCDLDYFFSEARKEGTAPHTEREEREGKTEHEPAPQHNQRQRKSEVRGRKNQQPHRRGERGYVLGRGYPTYIRALCRCIFRSEKRKKTFIYVAPPVY